MRGNYQVRFCGGRGAVMLFSPTQHPQLATILALTLTRANYIEFGTFSGKTSIHSPQSGNLELTADQVFAAG